MLWICMQMQMQKRIANGCDNWLWLCKLQTVDTTAKGDGWGGKVDDVEEESETREEKPTKCE